jgi:hypothetical protein
MIGSDAKNRFRNIVSSKVVDECEHSRSALEKTWIVAEHHVGSFKG